MTQTHGVKITADENETYATQIKNKNNNGIKKVSAPFARGALLELFSNSIFIRGEINFTCGF